MNQQSRLLEEGLAMYNGMSEKIDKFLGQEEARLAAELSVRDALENDSLSICRASVPGHGFNDEVKYLHDKRAPYCELSVDAYRYLIKLAKIGLDSVRGSDRAPSA